MVARHYNTVPATPWPSSPTILKGTIVTLVLLGLWGLSTSHIPMIYLPNPTRFGSSHSTSKYFDPHPRPQDAALQHVPDLLMWAILPGPNIPSVNASEHL